MNRRCVPMVVWGCSFSVLVGLAVSAYADNYARRLTRETVPRLDDAPESARDLYRMGVTAHRKGDAATALEAFTQLVEEQQHGDPDLLTHFMAYLALCQEENNKHPLAVETLYRLRALRSEPEAEEIRFLADLEIARLMAQCGGHPNIPDFDPTIFEKEEQFQHLFETYSPYRREIMKAHIEFAQEASEAALGDPALFEYLATAIRELEEVQDIVKQLNANPSLASDEATLESLMYFSEYATRKIPKWQRTYESRVPDRQILKNPGEDSERMELAGALFSEDSSGAEPISRGQGLPRSDANPMSGNPDKPAVRPGFRAMWRVVLLVLVLAGVAAAVFIGIRHRRRAAV